LTLLFAGQLPVWKVHRICGICHLGNIRGPRLVDQFPDALITGFRLEARSFECSDSSFGRENALED
jgi:hypothetical protein